MYRFGVIFWLYLLYPLNGIATIILEIGPYFPRTLWYYGIRSLPIRSFSLCPDALFSKSSEINLTFESFAKIIFFPRAQTNWNIIERCPDVPSILCCCGIRSLPIFVLSLAQIHLVPYAIVAYGPNLIIPWRP